MSTNATLILHRGKQMFMSKVIRSKHLEREKKGVLQIIEADRNEK